MATATHAVTITGANGRIWTVKPDLLPNGLVTVLQLPSVSVSSLVKHAEFTACSLNGSADQLVTVDSKGTVYAYQLRNNRYNVLDKVGHHGTSVAFPCGNARLLFVSFSDASIKCYDLAKNVPVGYLKEHRSHVRNMEAIGNPDELISTSQDNVVIWDTKKLQRKRVLGSGPYGALKAAYSADKKEIIAAFKDGSYYVWNAATFKLVRSFTLPTAHILRSLHQTFALSPDGQLLVSGGPSPLLFVFNVVGGIFLFALHLPDSAVGTGAQQLHFLPDSSTLAVLCMDGAVRFADIRSGAVVMEIPYHANAPRDCSISIDDRGNHMALIADGKVWLYDLATARKTAYSSNKPCVSLARVDLVELEEQATAMLAKQSNAAPQPHALTREAPADAGAGMGTAQGRAGARAGQGDIVLRLTNGSPPRGSAGVMQSITNNLFSSPDGSKRSKRQGRGAPGKSPGTAAKQELALQPAPPGAAAGVTLNRERLQSLLESFGEYPAKYRLLIWDFLLQLPHNTAAFQTLLAQGLHPSYEGLPANLPLHKALASRLSQALSQLAHWCPVFGEASFLPDLVFPFVKLFAAAGVATNTEACFEMLATMLTHWTRNWFERFPHPPLGVLNRLQDLLHFHDSPLASHFQMYRGGLASVAWGMLKGAMSELLCRSDWLKLWDHCFTAGPDYIYFFIAGYLIYFRSTLLQLDTDAKLANWLATCPPLNMNKVLRDAYGLRMRTPDPLLPASPDWQPLPKAAAYADFKDYPAGAVELFAQDRTKIKHAEDAIMRRKKVVSELEVRSRSLALQAASLSSERQQLAALEEQRRAALRDVEGQMLEEMARLDDRAKEEKLRQIGIMERAYQGSMVELRQAWQRELENVKAEVAHKRSLATYQVRSREEDEDIKALEFQARQRMWALEQDNYRAAVSSKVRDELAVQINEVEARKRAKEREWEAEEEARRLRLEHEAARRARMSAQAEEEAARAAASREALGLQLQIEEGVLKVDSQVRLRRLAEEQAALTCETLALEAQRQAARTRAADEALQLQGKTDLAWYEAEQARREALLAEEKRELETAAAATRQRLNDTEIASRTLGTQAALLDRRRFLERQNAAEEDQARSLVTAMAAERARDAQLMSELVAKEAEMKAEIDHAARVGSLQREVESSEEAAARALRADLAVQQRAELEVLQRRHEAVLQRVAADREQKMPALAADWRVRLQADQLQDVLEAQRAFEQRKAVLMEELARKEVLAAGYDPKLPRTAATGQAHGQGAYAAAGYQAAAAGGHAPPYPARDPRVTPTRSAMLSESNLTPGSIGSIASSLEAARRPLPVHLPHAAMGSEALRAALRRSAPALSEVSMDDSELGSMHAARHNNLVRSMAASAAAANAVGRAACAAAHTSPHRHAARPLERDPMDMLHAHLRAPSMSSIDSFPSGLTSMQSSPGMGGMSMPDAAVPLTTRASVVGTSSNTAAAPYRSSMPAHQPWETSLGGLDSLNVSLQDYGLGMGMGVSTAPLPPQANTAAPAYAYGRSQQELYPAPPAPAGKSMPASRGQAAVASSSVPKCGSVLRFSGGSSEATFAVSRRASGMQGFGVPAAAGSAMPQEPQASTFVPSHASSRSSLQQSGLMSLASHTPADTEDTASSGPNGGSGGVRSNATSTPYPASHSQPSAQHTDSFTVAMSQGIAASSVGLPSELASSSVSGGRSATGSGAGSQQISGSGSGRGDARGSSSASSGRRPPVATSTTLRATSAPRIPSTIPTSSDEGALGMGSAGQVSGHTRNAAAGAPPSPPSSRAAASSASSGSSAGAAAGPRAISAGKSTDTMGAAHSSAAVPYGMRSPGHAAAAAEEFLVQSSSSGSAYDHNSGPQHHQGAAAGARTASATGSDRVNLSSSALATPTHASRGGTGADWVGQDSEGELMLRRGTPSDADALTELLVRYRRPAGQATDSPSANASQRPSYGSGGVGEAATGGVSAGATQRPSGLVHCDDGVRRRTDRPQIQSPGSVYASPGYEAAADIEALLQRFRHDLEIDGDAGRLGNVGSNTASPSSMWSSMQAPGLNTILRSLETMDIDTPAKQMDSES